MAKQGGNAAKAALVERCRVPFAPVPGRKAAAGGSRFRLSACPHGEPGLISKKRGQEELERELARIDELQEVFYADGRHALLVVLQAMDTGGKDGTVRKVFGTIDPLGIVATSFKKPTGQELAHDYLWRVHHAVPAKGMIGIFNRSHYEDVLIVRVHGWAAPDAIERRYGQINDFERHLTENGVTILKLFLHISKDEQRRRLQSRIDEPSKHWKFNLGDLDERKRWDDYQAAYEIALRRCSTPWAPWYVIPAEDKWYRNLLVAQLVRRTLERLDPRYPAAAPGLKKLVIV